VFLFGEEPVRLSAAAGVTGPEPLARFQVSMDVLSRGTAQASVKFRFCGVDYVFTDFQVLTLRGFIARFRDVARLEAQDPSSVTAAE
jgi:hypothetical protein